MQDIPLITIGIPIYNGDPWIEETIASIKIQSEQNFEVLICDNASTDNTESICRKIVAEDSRFKYIRNSKNIGAPRNYNLAIEAATGEYFKWNSASDLCLPELLETCINVLAENKEVSLCYSRTAYLNENGEKQYIDRQLELLQSSPSERFIRFCEEINLNNMMNGVMRTKQLRGTMLNQQYFASDICLMAEIVLLGKVVQLPEYLFIRRMSEDTSSSLVSETDQQRYIDPELKSRMLFQHMKQFRGFFNAVIRTKIEKREKMKLYRYLFKRIRFARRELWGDITQAVKSFFVQRNPAA